MTAIYVTVSDPDGPRAAAPDPPFATAVPLRDVAVVALPGPPDRGRAVRVRVDCSDHPAAAEFLASESQRLHVHIDMRTHETGNGYVVIGIGPFDQPAVVEVALDPARHAELLDSLHEAGHLLISDATDARRRGWSFSLDTDLLARMTVAAKAHPRRISFEPQGGGGRGR